MSQVLKLEFVLEEEEGTVVELKQQLLQQSQQERDAVCAAAAAAAVSSDASLCAVAAGFAAASSTAVMTMHGSVAASGAVSAAAAAVPASGPSALLPSLNTSTPVPSNLSIYDGCSDDGWASTPTVDLLLSKIVALWEELYVPLAYRSRFFLSFRGREVFYYEVEARRLEWKRSQMMLNATEEASLAGVWTEQQQQQQHLAQGSYASCLDIGAAGPGTPSSANGRGASTPRPTTSASAATAALTASSSFAGTRRRSRELDKAAR
jgi:hypothetical protein